MRVAILGNCIYDTVECSGAIFNRTGGICNLSRANPQFDVYARVGLDSIGREVVKSEITSPMKSGRFFVKKSRETSCAQLRLEMDGRTKSLITSNIAIEELECPYFKYDWIHISYLNKVKITPYVWSKIRAARIVSGDSCAGAGDFPYELDVVFQSLDEPRSAKAGIKICHSPTFSIINDDKKVEHSDFQVLNRHILGAGDYFASNFINESAGFSSLELIKLNISEIIKKSHLKTSQNITDFNV